MRRHEHEQVVLGLLPLERAHVPAAGSTDSTLKNVVSSMPRSLDDRLDHLERRLDRERPVQRRQQGHAAPARETAALAQVLRRA